MSTIKKQWSSGTGEVTINYDGSGNGQITIISDGNNLYEARSMQIVVQTTAGSHQQTKTVNISQAARVRTDISNAVVTASNQTYNGSAKTPTPTVKLNGVTIPSTGYDVTYSNNTNAGTATVTVTGKGDYTGTASGTFTIAKANPTYTAPAAQSLTYSGGSQYLTTSGSTSHGTIQYSADGTNWYTTRRTKTNAGTYTTYWRLVGDTNHNDVSSTSINVTIAQKALTITAKAQTITYGGSIATGTSQVTTSGLVSGDSLTAVTLTASTSSVTTSGTITPSAATTSNGIGNYSVTYATGNLTINKAASSVTSAPTAKSLTYSRSAQSLVNAGSASGGTLYYKYTTTNSKPTSTSGFSSSIPTRTDAGTYYVWYYVKGDSNHNDTAISSTAVTVTITKATPVVATAPSKRTGLSYTGSAQNLLSGGSMKHSSSDSTSVAGTFTYAQGTNAGSYSSLTWSFTPTDSTNYNSASSTVSGSVSIAKASISPTVSINDWAYGETPSNPSVSGNTGGGNVTYSYKLSTEPDSAYTTTKPSSVGNYTIKAVIAETTNYLGATTTSNFEIKLPHATYVRLSVYKHNYPQLNKDSLKPINLIDPNSVNIIDNHYINIEGGTASNSNFYISDYIPVFEGETYFAGNNGSVASSILRTFEFYDASKNVIHGSFVNNVTSPLLTSFTAPEGAVYVRISVDKRYINKPQLNHGSLKSYTVYSDNLIDINNNNIIDNSYINIEGSIGSNNNYFVTDYIPVVSGSTYYAGYDNSTDLGTEVLRTFEFYDVNKNVIHGSFVNNVVSPLLKSFTAP